MSDLFDILRAEQAIITSDLQKLEDATAGDADRRRSLLAEASR